MNEIFEKEDPILFRIYLTIFYDFYIKICLMSRLY